MNDLVSRAKAFATLHHEAVGQRRKYTNEPYIVHPAGVAALVMSVPHTQEMLAAAWLHDVVEDTGVSLDEIHREFGKAVGDMVEMLTDVSRPEDGNREKRKAIDREHTSRASPDAKTIKLADLINNSETIVAHDPQFAIVYLREKRQLLEVLQDGDGTLLMMAHGMLHRNLTRLSLPMLYFMG